MRPLVAGLWLCVAPAAAMAQGLTGSIGGVVGAVRTKSLIAAATDVATGAVIGVAGHVGISRVTVDVFYAQGSLSPDLSGAEARDYVEGDVYLSIVTFPGLILRGGPHARAYISETGTQRWLFWTGHVRYEFEMIRSPSIVAFAEGWSAFSAEINVSEEFDNARGASVGLSARIPGSGFYGRLSYGIEQARLGGGARSEDVESLVLVVGFGRR